MRRWFDNGMKDLGGLILFSITTAKELRRHGVSPTSVIEQMYAVGVRSFTTTTVAGLFVGAIMAIQIHLQLRDFGAEAFLGGLSTSVTIRNVGPVLIAFILSGKVGAYTSAELGTMQVTDQLNAIRCLGADPIRYLVLPRLVAVSLSSFLLLIVGLMMTILGGTLISSVDLGVAPASFILYIPRFVGGWSIATGIVKSFVFGNVIGLIACYRGYTASGGAVGVGRSVRDAAVECLVAIILCDFAISHLSSLLQFLLNVGAL